MKWAKKGLIIAPDKNKWWAISHAMIPTPDDLGNGIFRIYYSGRNSENQSHIGWSDIDLNNSYKIISNSKEPVLRPGKLGCFDDNGVTPSCVINISNNEKALYYIGWNPGSTVRMHLFGGLAISNDNGKTFTRWSESPIIERNKNDHYLNTAPWVVKVEDGFRMYYVSGVEWKHKDLPRYNIKVAFSSNGKDWVRNGHICINFKNEDENALARPYVIKDGSIWKMWFAYKGAAYKIGYAESVDGINWDRNDSYNYFLGGESNFDSKMMEYAAIVSYKNRKYMFYNGNNYGYDGIGLAVEE